MQELIVRVRTVIDLISAGGTFSLDMLEEVSLILAQIVAILRSWQKPDAPDAPSIFGSTPEVQVDDLESCLNQLSAVSQQDSGQAFGANPLVTALLMKLAELLIKELEKKLFSR